MFLEFIVETHSNNVLPYIVTAPSVDIVRELSIDLGLLLNELKLTLLSRVI